MVHEDAALLNRPVTPMTPPHFSTGVYTLFGLVAFPLGLYLWHKQGPHFGLGEVNGRVSTGATVISASLFLVVVGVELVQNVK